MAMVAMAPTPTVPMMNFLRMPCMSAMEPRMGMSRAMMSEAMVSAKPQAPTATCSTAGSLAAR